MNIASASRRPPQLSAKKLLSSLLLTAAIRKSIENSLCEWDLLTLVSSSYAQNSKCLGLIWIFGLLWANRFAEKQCVRQLVFEIQLMYTDTSRVRSILPSCRPGGLCSIPGAFEDAGVRLGSSRAVCVRCVRTERERLPNGA